MLRSAVDGTSRTVQAREGEEGIDGVLRELREEGREPSSEVVVVVEDEQRGFVNDEISSFDGLEGNDSLSFARNVRDLDERRGVEEGGWLDGEASMR